jgi:alpha-L-fucosidase
MRLTHLLPCLLATILGSAAMPAVEGPAATPATSNETPAARDARMAWWREARFGMFVHWGLYSGLAGTYQGKAYTKGGVEWIQKFSGAPTEEYAKAALPLFVPTADFAKGWAKLAKQAGCRYLVFTTKHHDGFALHDSKLGDYNAGLLLKRDLVREIVDAVHAEGLKVGFYHSLIDWHHDQYDWAKAKNLPYPGKPTSPAPRDHQKYISYLHGQVAELMHNYGPIDILWWDYSSKGFQGDEAWGASELIRQVRAKQPGIIMNNRLYAADTVHAGTGEAKAIHGDFDTPEQRIPATGLPGVDWETCMTLNGTWGFSDHDHSWKTPETLIRNLVDIASKGGNYLLNIGPKGDGSLSPETVASFTAIGKWLEVNGVAIYGTTASPVPKPEWGRVTRKGGTVFLQVFTWPKDGILTLPLANAATKVSLLADPAAKITSEATPAGLRLTLPAQAPDPIASVIAVELTGEPQVVPGK